MFKEWKEAELQADASEVVTWKKYRYTLESDESKEETNKISTPVTAQEYYEWLEDNQRMYEIMVPNEFSD